MPSNLGMFDEGIILTGAMRVLAGDVLHRDFYSNYGPAQYYLVAGLFKAFGSDFLAARLFDLTIRAGILAVLFHIIARNASVAIGLGTTAVAALWMIDLGNYLYPVFPCLLLALVGSNLLVVLGSTAPSVRDTATAGLGAGICAGLTLLFRYDSGALLAAANLLAAAALIWRANPPGGRLVPFVNAGGAYVFALLIVAAPVVALFLSVSPIEPFLQDIVSYGANTYPAMRRLPFPGAGALAADPQRLVVYMPLLAVALAGLTLRRTAARERSAGLGPVSSSLVIFGFMAGFFFLKGVVRVSPLHMFLALGPSLVVFAIVLHTWRQGAGVGRFLAPMLIVLVAAPAVAAAARGFPTGDDPGRPILASLAARGGSGGPGLDDASACALGPASGVATLSADYGPVARYLNASTRPDDRILVGLNRHDRIYINALGLYFASGRLPATHWHQYDPGLQTRADIQMAMIEELKRKRVDWVVRDGSYAAVREPNASAVSSGVRLLDRYLDQNYRLAASVGAVEIWAAASLDRGPAERLPPCPRPQARGTKP